MKKLLSLTLFTFVLAGCASTTEDNKEANVLEVASYVYHNDNEVDVDVLLDTGHKETVLCAFPPNTDFKNMGWVKIGDLREEYLLGTSSFYCNPIALIPTATSIPRGALDEIDFAILQETAYMDLVEQYPDYADQLAERKQELAGQDQVTLERRLRNLGDGKGLTTMGFTNDELY